MGRTCLGCPVDQVPAEAQTTSFPPLPLWWDRGLHGTTQCQGSGHRVPYPGRQDPHCPPESPRAPSCRSPPGLAPGRPGTREKPCEPAGARWGLGFLPQCSAGVARAGRKAGRRCWVGPGWGWGWGRGPGSPFVWEEGLSGIPEGPHSPRTHHMSRQAPPLVSESPGRGPRAPVGVEQVSSSLLPRPPVTRGTWHRGGTAAGEAEPCSPGSRVWGWCPWEQPRPPSSCSSPQVESIQLGLQGDGRGSGRRPRWVGAGSQAPVLPSQSTSPLWAPVFQALPWDAQTQPCSVCSAELLREALASLRGWGRPRGVVPSVYLCSGQLSWAGRGRPR